MAETVLESAIPPHLQVPRTCPMRLPADYEPAFPAYCARLSPATRDVVMTIVGAQHADQNAATEAHALAKIMSYIKQEPGLNSPKHWDMASVTDAQGFYNECVIAYWDDKATFEAWRSSSGFKDWWQSLDADTEQHGWWLEVLLPSIDRVETVYSDLNEPEGHGHMREKLSSAIQEHVYWGSMRDRLPASQTDELVGEKAVTPDLPTDTTKARVRIPGKQNLCIIRSGQDWSKTNPEERKLYLDTMHPVLIKGMTFLRDNGDDVGCYSCRFMDIVDQKSMKSGDTDQTFGLAYFDDIANLEKWSREHQTHLNIFGGFLQYVKKLNFNVTLHLYHEVFVLKPEQQIFEYVGCHAKTGMMRHLQSKSNEA